MARRKVNRGRRIRGRGAFVDFFKKVGNWFKKTGIISKVAGALGAAGVPYASQVASGAAHLGLGRRRKRISYRRR